MGLCILLFLSSFGSAFAQQDPHHSQYLFNQLSINPAYAGSRQTIVGSFFHRSQWTGFEGAPVTQAISFHMPSRKKRYGFGMNLINDAIGYTRQQWVTGSYSFFIPVRSFSLGLGLRGGFLNYRINWNEIRAVDQVDGVFLSNPSSILLPNVGAGIFLSNERLYFGLSAPHILNSGLQNGNPAQTLVARLYRHYYATAGIVLFRDKQVEWKPSFLLKYVPGAPLQADFNLMALIRKRIWLGMSYRSSDALAFMMDVRIGKIFRLGYAYDHTLSALAGLQNGTHELHLGLEIFSENAKMKSPRYF